MRDGRKTSGPVVPKSEPAAIEAANNTEFGLASYFWSRDVGRTFRVAGALEYCMVGSISASEISAAHD